MAKKKRGMSYGGKKDFSDYDSGYYEPFAGYYNSTKDQAVYWNTVKTSKGVIPKQFMEVTIPMADDVGEKGQYVPKIGLGK